MWGIEIIMWIPWFYTYGFANSQDMEETFDVVFSASKIPVISLSLLQPPQVTDRPKYPDNPQMPEGEKGFVNLRTLTTFVRRNYLLSMVSERNSLGGYLRTSGGSKP